MFLLVTAIRHRVTCYFSSNTLTVTAGDAVTASPKDAAYAHPYDLPRWRLI